jgi:hypothetical protein
VSKTDESSHIIYRKELFDQMHESSKSVDRGILLISSAIIGLSFPILERNIKFQYTHFFIVGEILLVSAIIFSLISLHVTQWSSASMLKRYYEYYFNNRKDCDDVPKLSWIAYIPTGFQILASFSFCIALIKFIFFITYNIS